MFIKAILSIIIAVSIPIGILALSKRIPAFGKILYSEGSSGSNEHSDIHKSPGQYVASLYG